MVDVVKSFRTRHVQSRTFCALCSSVGLNINLAKLMILGSVRCSPSLRSGWNFPLMEAFNLRGDTFGRLKLKAGVSSAPSAPRHLLTFLKAIRLEGWT